MIKHHDIFIRAIHWESVSNKNATVSHDCPEDIAKFVGDFATICSHRAAECRAIGVLMRDGKDE